MEKQTTFDQSTAIVPVPEKYVLILDDVSSLTPEKVCEILKKYDSLVIKKKS